MGSEWTGHRCQMNYSWASECLWRCSFDALTFPAGYLRDWNGVGEYGWLSHYLFDITVTCQPWKGKERKLYWYKYEYTSHLFSRGAFPPCSCLTACRRLCSLSSNRVLEENQNQICFHYHFNCQHSAGSAWHTDIMRDFSRRHHAASQRALSLALSFLLSLSLVLLCNAICQHAICQQKCIHKPRINHARCILVRIIPGFYRHIYPSEHRNAEPA